MRQGLWLNIWAFGLEGQALVQGLGRNAESLGCAGL